jgi:hypothetical protein
MEHGDQATSPRYAVEDLVSGRPLIRSTSFDEAARVVRELAASWPEVEDEVVIIPAESSLLPS